MSRKRNHSSTQFSLYPAETLLGWRVIRNVSYAQGEEMVVQGKWREVYDEHGNHIGYQMRPSRSDDLEILSRSSSSGIVRSEMEINAGRVFSKGKSHTAGMSEARRMIRTNRDTGKALPPEDRIERVTSKVRVWPDVEACANDILRVWPR